MEEPETKYLVVQFVWRTPVLGGLGVTPDLPRPYHRSSTSAEHVHDRIRDNIVKLNRDWHLAITAMDQIVEQDGRG